MVKQNYMILIKPSSLLESMMLPVQPTSEEVQAVSIEHQRVMQPIRNYLNQIGLTETKDYKVNDNSFRINNQSTSAVACLTPEQKEEIKQFPYVMEVMKNFEMIERPKLKISYE